MDCEDIADGIEQTQFAPWNKTSAQSEMIDLST